MKNIIIFKFNLFLVNKFFVGTRFFKIKRKLLRNVGFRIGENSKIVGPVIIGRGASLEVGINSWIGKNLTVYGDGDLKIGDNCDIAPDVTFMTGSHKLGDSNRRAGEGLTFNYLIGDGNWIGARTVFINGALIGNSNVVGACSLINKNFDSNFIILGSPAKIYKSLV